jgi:hypothetical protein
LAVARKQAYLFADCLCKGDRDGISYLGGY